MSATTANKANLFSPSQDLSIFADNPYMTDVQTSPLNAPFAWQNGIWRTTITKAAPYVDHEIDPDGWWVRGEIWHKDEPEAIGDFERILVTDAPIPYVMHTDMALVEGYQRKGFSRDFLSHCFSEYKKLGMGYVELWACQSGGEAWSRLGCTWHPEHTQTEHLVAMFEGFSERADTYCDEHGLVYLPPLTLAEHAKTSEWLRSLVTRSERGETIEPRDLLAWQEKSEDNIPLARYALASPGFYGYWKLP